MHAVSPLRHCIHQDRMPGSVDYYAKLTIYFEDFTQEKYKMHKLYNVHAV